MKNFFSFFFLLCVLCASVANSEAANVRTWFVNPFTAANYTNSFVATKISTNILANGGVTPIGLPVRITPATNGYATNYFAQGWYALSNNLLGNGVVINVYDATTTQYDYTNLLQSGFNTYAVTVYGTNPPPTYAAVTNALGFLPPTFAQVTNISTNADFTLSNGLYTIAVTLSVANSNNAALLSTNGTNFSLSIGLADTNFTKAVGLSLTNLAKSFGAANTNFTLATSNALYTLFTNRITTNNLTAQYPIVISGGVASISDLFGTDGALNNWLNAGSQRITNLVGLGFGSTGKFRVDSTSSNSVVLTDGSGGYWGRLLAGSTNNATDPAYTFYDDTRAGMYLRRYLPGFLQPIIGLGFSYGGTELFWGSNLGLTNNVPWNGDFSGATNLNASSLASGTVADARLAATIARTANVGILSTNSTNFSLLLAGYGTNNAAALSNALRNFVLSCGLVTSNYATAQAQYYANNTATNATNYTLSNGLLATNYTKAMGLVLTNFIYAQGVLQSNYAIAQAQYYANNTATNATNYTLSNGLLATNYAKAMGLVLTNFIYAQGVLQSNYALAQSQFYAGTVGTNTTNFAKTIGLTLTNYAQPTNFNLTRLSTNNGGSLTNLAGGNIQTGTINSNKLDAATLALLGTGSGSGGIATNGGHGITNQLTLPSLISANTSGNSVSLANSVNLAVQWNLFVGTTTLYPQWPDVSLLFTKSDGPQSKIAFTDDGAIESRTNYTQDSFATNYHALGGSLYALAPGTNATFTTNAGVLTINISTNITASGSIANNNGVGTNALLYNRTTPQPTPAQTWTNRAAPSYDYGSVDFYPDGTGWHFRRSVDSSASVDWMTLNAGNVGFPQPTTVNSLTNVSIYYGTSFKYRGSPSGNDWDGLMADSDGTTLSLKRWSDGSTNVLIGFDSNGATVWDNILLKTGKSYYGNGLGLTNVPGTVTNVADLSSGIRLSNKLSFAGGNIITNAVNSGTLKIASSNNVLIAQFKTNQVNLFSGVNGIYSFNETGDFSLGNATDSIFRSGSIFSTGMLDVQSSNITAVGTVTANSFRGDGSSLTNLVNRPIIKAGSGITLVITTNTATGQETNTISASGGGASVGWTTNTGTASSIAGTNNTYVIGQAAGGGHFRATNATGSIVGGIVEDPDSYIGVQGKGNQAFGYAESGGGIGVANGVNAAGCVAGGTAGNYGRVSATYNTCWIWADAQDPGSEATASYAASFLIGVASDGGHLHSTGVASVVSGVSNHTNSLIYAGGKGAIAAGVCDGGVGGAGRIMATGDAASARGYASILDSSATVDTNALILASGFAADVMGMANNGNIDGAGTVLQGYGHASFVRGYGNVSALGRGDFAMGHNLSTDSSNGSTDSNFGDGSFVFGSDYANTNNQSFSVGWGSKQFEVGTTGTTNYGILSSSGFANSDVSIVVQSAAGFTNDGNYTLVVSIDATVTGNYVKYLGPGTSPFKTNSIVVGGEEVILPINGAIQVLSGTNVKIRSHRL